MQNKILAGMLIVLWLAFLLWQIKVQKWLGEVKSEITRLDLILVLPGLIIITILVILLIRSDSKK